MVKEITSKALEQKIKAGERVNVIDVREADEVAMGKLPEAEHIPMGEIPNRLNEFNKDQHYFIICRSGARSGRVCEFLTQFDYDATNVVGGMLDWEGEVE